jgi:hypothetical protein
MEVSIGEETILGGLCRLKEDNFASLVMTIN